MITKPKYWTEPKVRATLLDMLRVLRSEKDPKTWHITLGGLCIKYNVHRQRIPEWEKEYVHNEEIADSIKKIFSILETRINEGALRGQLSVAPAIFNLKNNYGWKDTHEIHDDRNDRLQEEVTEIRNRIAERYRKNIKIPKGSAIPKTQEKKNDSNNPI